MGMYNFISTGIVVDTNDPQNLGRIRVYCQSFGDMPNTQIEDLPWCRYMTPFGGVLNDSNITRDDSSTADGPVAYGFWGIPKAGAQAVVTCVDGDPTTRIWMGCLPPPGLNNTLSHGRWNDTSVGKNDGPLTSTNNPIQPTYSNFRTAFGGPGNPIWDTRAADNQVAALTKADAAAIGMDVVEDTAEGYGISRINPNLKYNYTTTNKDSHVYSWTTPGFHSISMDDRKDGSRMRFRSCGGHQIIFDDTNNFVYINTAQGANWIELNQDGHIDIYAGETISIHSTGDLNLSADDAIRMSAGTGIHLLSGEDIRLTAAADVHIMGVNLRVSASGGGYIQSGADMNIASGSDCKITGGTLQLDGAGGITASGATIHLNEGAATPASGANAISAVYPSRIPQHEPWPRSDSANDFSAAPEFTDFTYSSSWSGSAL